jgi:hypothetical protein
MQFSAATYTVGEGAGTAAIVISRTGSTAGATVDYATSDGTGTAGTDYTTTTGTATFAVGQTALTFLVPVANTAAADGVRTVNLTLSNPGPPNATTTLGARSTAVLRIIDNEVSVGFSAPNYTVRENAGLATITVELTGVNATPVTVRWATSNGTATAGADYGIRGAGTPPGPTPPPTGVLTFPVGGTPTTVRTRTFTVPILNNTIVEGTETVNLTLSSPSPGVQLVTGRDTAVLSITE